MYHIGSETVSKWSSVNGQHFLHQKRRETNIEPCERSHKTNNGTILNLAVGEMDNGSYAQCVSQYLLLQLPECNAYHLSKCRYLHYRLEQS